MTRHSSQLSTHFPGLALALILLVACGGKGQTGGDAGVDDPDAAIGDSSVGDSGPSPTGTTEITQYGVTWTFSEEVEYGTFVNGDYYIVDSGSGITVTSITPVPVNGTNGSMKNPVPGAGQGFDSSGLDYEEALAVVVPVGLSAGDALLSSISLDGTESGNWAGDNIGSNPKLRTVAVLTVLSGHPPVGTFRPSYADRSQNLYNIDQINFGVLPQVGPVPTLPSHGSFGAVEYFERGMERPWILFGNDWQSRAIHPTQNMLDYHEKIGFFLSEASLLLATNVPDTETLLVRYLQVGIDYFYCDNSDSSVWAWPIVFTGLLFDEEPMYRFWLDNPTRRNQRGHEKLYYVQDVAVSTSSSIIPLGETWVDWTTTDGRHVAFRKQVGEEYEHLHPSEWQCYEPHCKSEVYRTQHDVYPLIGLTLSSILVDRQLTAVDVNALLAHDPIRDYCDRWMSNIFNVGVYQPSGNTYLQEMENSQTFTIYYYRYGSGASDFIDDLWATHR